MITTFLGSPLSCPVGTMLCVGEELELIRRQRHGFRIDENVDGAEANGRASRGGGGRLLRM